MTTLLRALTARRYSAGILSGAIVSHRMQNSTSCETSSVNPLLNQESTPKFAEIKVEHVVPAVQQDLKSLESKFSDLEKSLSGTNAKVSYQNVVDEMERINGPLGYSWGVVGHLMGVKNSDGLRAAHKALQPSVIEANQRMGQSENVYKALVNVKKTTSEWNALDEAQRRIIDASIRDMESSGIGLPAKERAVFNALQKELADLSTKFSNNVLDSTKQFRLRLTFSGDVAGLPPSAMALAAQQSATFAKAATTTKEALKKELVELSGEASNDAKRKVLNEKLSQLPPESDTHATAEKGPWTITLDLPSYLPTMQHMKSGVLREKLYRAYVTRASSGEHDNVPIINRILQIKTEMAKMLGYQCFAEKSLAKKMADDVDAVMKLIEMLREKSMPYAQKDLADVKAFAKSKGFDGELQLWDVPFWSERLREAQYEFSEEQLRPYFALPEVLTGLFTLANRLFGVTITPSKEGVQVWHADVKYFNIHDTKTGKYLASFYLDPYSRPEEKRGGAWMNVCLGRSDVLNRTPVTYLICNGSPPVGKKPSLMTFREVETLFHEFGHGLQHMLTTVPHGDAAGIHNVEWDAVELPSQFMENWCYDKPTLYKFARHYETGEPLPEVLFEKVKKAKNFQAGMQMIRQLYFGSMDMYLHSTKYDAVDGKRSIFDVQHEIAKQYTVIPPLPSDRFLCSFSHIFAGGYSAGYYSYKWAEVMSADAFAAFEEAGLSNEDAVRKTGRRFRDTVLSMGGGKHPSEVFRLFRGRDPSPEALLRHNGLAGDKK